MQWRAQPATTSGPTANALPGRLPGHRYVLTLDSSMATAMQVRTGFSEEPVEATIGANAAVRYGIAEGADRLPQD